jgi:hypothetical protein
MCEAGRMERRSSRGLRAGAATCLLAMTANGCSFIFAAGPPPNHREMRYFDCPSSYAPPAIDTAIAVTGGLVSLVAIAFAAHPVTFSYIHRPDAQDGAPAVAQLGASGEAVLIAIPLVLVGLPAVSAIYGSKKVGSCRDAKAELVARINAVPAGALPPGPYEPPPGP